MSFYFSGPWGDQSSGVAGLTVNPIKSRISVKEKGKIAGYEGSIGNSTTTGRITATGGVGVVKGSPFTMSCWVLLDQVPHNTFGTAISVNFEPSPTTSTSADYHFYELGFIGQNITPPGAVVCRPYLRVRRSTATTVNQRTSPIAGVSAWFGPTLGGYLNGNEWIHIAGRVTGTGSSNRTLNVFVNGVYGGTATILSSQTPETVAGKTFNRTTLGGIKVCTTTSGGAAGVENGFKGYIAEAAIWDIGLSNEEIKSLANGVPSDRVGSSNLVFYAPLIRDLNTVVGDYVLSPESGTTFTSLPVTGLTFISPLYFAHPQTGITETHPRRYGR